MTAIHFAVDDIIEVGTADIERLKAAALQSSSGRARYCFHQDDGSVVHDMLIAFCGYGYVRAHRHPRKAETLHAVEGEFDVVIFDDQAREVRRVRMGVPGGSRTVMYRLPAGIWHTVVPLTPAVVIHEVTQGPFSPDETEFPAWAPLAGDTAGVKAFLARIAG